MSTTVNKSYENASGDPVIDYCSKLTSKMEPMQMELQKETLANAERSQMLGAPEVLTIGSHFLKVLKAKKAIDIGTYTGASAIAWALAMGDDSEVITLDISHANYRKHGLPILQKNPQIHKKIKAIEGPALEYLDSLLSSGHQNSFDFAFIDADKENYSNYYDRCVQLLRPGGVVLVDNSLWNGKVAVKIDENDKETKAIDEMNNKVFNDERTLSFLINCGDGLHVAFKQ